MSLVYVVYLHLNGCMIGVLENNHCSNFKYFCTLLKLVKDCPQATLTFGGACPKIQEGWQRIL